MREIKFRGKRIDTGEWAYGDLLHRHIGGITHSVIRAHKDTEGFYDLFEVDPETVGQYTGLKDNCGVEIFEGDAISTSLSRPYLIVVHRGGGLMFQCKEGVVFYDIIMPFDDPSDVYLWGKVIGNIHDNPELLEEEKK